MNVPKNRAYSPAASHRPAQAAFVNGVAEMALLIPLLAIAGGIFLGALRIWKGDGGPARQSNNAEEARLIQDIYHGLLKMEERVEALETLLLERERENEKKEAQS